MSTRIKITGNASTQIVFCQKLCHLVSHRRKYNSFSSIIGNCQASESKEHTFYQVRLLQIIQHVKLYSYLCPKYSKLQITRISFSLTYATHGNKNNKTCVDSRFCKYLLHNIWMCQFFQKRYLTNCCARNTF